MVSKHIVFGSDARQRIARGLDTLANAVKVTLGPRGRNVALERGRGSPTITKDGVTVAKVIELDDHFANLGAQMVKEVAAKTAQVAGDGTTTATVLAQALYAHGVKLVAAGASPMELKRGIDAAVEVVVRELVRASTPAANRKEIAQVGTISANGDETIGALISEAMERVGKEGVITIEESQAMESSLEVAEGLQFERGYLSPYFVTDPLRMEAVLEDAFVLICDRRISTFADCLPLLEAVAKVGAPLLVVAEDVDGEALATLVVNKLKGTLSACAVKGPGFGAQRKDLLEDLAIMTGGQAVTAQLGLTLERVGLKELGRVRKVVVTKDTTTLIDGLGQKRAVQVRVEQLRAHLLEATQDYDREKLEERLAKLVGGVAVLKLGAATQTELEEKRARVEDALHATRAAVEEGVVPGGGVALLRALPALDRLSLPGDQQYGVELVRRALEEPLRQMAQNGGQEGSVVVARVRAGTGAFGFNVATQVYEDLLAAGVIDATKVVRVALQNAASVASLMLTTEAVVAERPAA